MQFRCNESIQFEAYGSLNRRLFKADEDEIFNMTGCLPKCDFYVYSGQPVGGLTNYHETNPKLNNTVLVQLYFPSASYQVMEQVNWERDGGILGKMTSDFETTV